MSVFIKKIHVLLGMLLIMVAGSAHAAMINYTITGDITDQGANTFGLLTGQTITASGVINTAPSIDYQIESGSLLGGDATGSINFGFGSGNTMTLTVGNTNFSPLDEYNYLSGSTTISFSAGLLLGVDSYIFPGTNGPSGFESLGLAFNDWDTMTGVWRTSMAFVSSTPSPVPVPAAAWLFGSGLLGLIGFAKRK